MDDHVPVSGKLPVGSLQEFPHHAARRTPDPVDGSGCVLDLDGIGRRGAEALRGSPEVLDTAYFGVATA